MTVINFRKDAWKPDQIGQLQALILEVDRLANQSGSSFFDLFSAIKESYDPPDLAPAAYDTGTMTVKGATFGCGVMIAFSDDLQGLHLSGYVSAADTVTYTLINHTAGNINLGSGTLRAFVFKWFSNR